MITNKFRDLTAAIVLLCAALVTLFVLIPSGIQVPETLQSEALSPAFWPRIISYAAIAASIFLLIETYLIKPQAAALSKEEHEEAALAYTASTGYLRVAILVVCLFGFYFSLTTLGIVAASGIFMAGTMFFFGERHIPLVLGLSIAAPLLLFFFFQHVAGVPIPLGIFAN